MKITKEGEKALNRSIVHWRKNVGALVKADKLKYRISQHETKCAWLANKKPIAYFGGADCELCHYYFDPTETWSNFCVGCPLKLKKMICGSKNSPWQKCLEAKGNKNIINAAKEMLDTLVEIKNNLGPSR